MFYNTHQLCSGLRVIHLPSASPVVYCGIAVKAGTRNELVGEEGLAHFCEHLAFKGTHRRSAVQIINALEGVGGELNAFTNKEDTVFYCAIQRHHFKRAADVLCDIVWNSAYPAHEVEKEREVVCDEIESYEDSPAELIFDDIENILFQNLPLGHNILGTAAQVRQYMPEDAQRFTNRHYRPENCVFFVSGDIDFNRLVKFLEKATGHAAELQTQSRAAQPDEGDTPLRADSTQQPSDDGTPLGGETIRERGTHQAHVIMAGRAYAGDNQRRWALYLLNNILGGPGLNSRLNLSLRERNGLVYSVESSMTCYRDTGLWAVYFGCDQHDVTRCRKLVRHELSRLAEQPLSAAQLTKAKRQLQGQLAIACDNREQFALDFARNYLHTGRLRDLTDIMRHIEGLTADDLLQTAQNLFADERIHTLIYQ